MEERMRSSVVELYYSISELCCIYRFSDKTVRDWVKSGRFSPPGPDEKPDLTNILDIGGDLRVPASGCLYFQANHPLKYDLGIRARNAGEMRRKIKQKESPNA